MKTFHEVGLPKEYSKKKKLELYKCWIISKDSDLTKTINDSLDINQARDHYGLTEKAAMSLAVTDFLSNDPLAAENVLNDEKDHGFITIAKMDSDETSTQVGDLIGKTVSKMDKLQEAIYVIAKITLIAGTMDEDVVVLPENPDTIEAHMNWDSTSYYDKELNTIWCTIHNRISDCEIHNYRVDNMKIEMVGKRSDEDEMYKVVDANLSEIILKG